LGPNSWTRSKAWMQSPASASSQSQASAPMGVAASGPASQDRFVSQEAEAQSVASRMPALLIEASRIAATLIHGVHGRRRAGPGETFWQFRQYGTNDDALTIDWRRSASSDQLYVREREWEAAHTFWLWPDLSASMQFKSHLADTTKRDRALVLSLALVEVLVKAGERVGLLGLNRPTASRQATLRVAETLAANASGPILTSGVPPREPLGRYTGVILISDFLEPVENLTERIAALSANGVNGHIIQVLDPAEEALPYEGRAEFVGMSGEVRWIAERAETVREDYQQKFSAHRQAIRDAARRAMWSFTVHHTDRSATEPLLALIMRLQAMDATRAVTDSASGAPPSS